MLDNFFTKSICLLALSGWVHPLLMAQSKEVFTVTDLAAEKRVEVKVNIDSLPNSFIPIP